MQSNDKRSNSPYPRKTADSSEFTGSGPTKDQPTEYSAWELLRWKENRTDEEASVEGNGSV